MSQQEGVTSVNGKILWGIMMGAGAWYLAPTRFDPALSMISFFFGAVAVACFIGAIRKMGENYKKKKALYEIEMDTTESRQSAFMDDKQRDAFRAKDLKG